jgi:hypothetical protein
MDPSPLEHLQHAEIKSLEGPLRALRYPQNELVPISSLPTELIDAIFSLLRVPGTSSPSTLGGKLDHLAWLRVAHVCHNWREVALNQPLFWSHVDFTTVSSAGAAEILAGRKLRPYIWRPRFPLLTGTIPGSANSEKNSKLMSPTYATSPVCQDSQGPHFTCPHSRVSFAGPPRLRRYNIHTGTHA